MTAPELVGTGETCEACGKRKAVGRSVGGCAICARCAGMAATLASEYAAEVEASRQRRSLRDASDLARIREKMQVEEAVIGDRQRARNAGRVR